MKQIQKYCEDVIKIFRLPYRADLIEFRYRADLIDSSEITYYEYVIRNFKRIREKCHFALKKSLCPIDRKPEFSKDPPKGDTMVKKEQEALYPDNVPYFICRIDFREKKIDV